MSSINRGKRDSDGLKSVAAIAIVFLIAAAGIIVWGYSKQAEYYRDADEHSYEYARNTYAPEANRCVVLPLEAQFDCIAKASDEYRNYRRDEYDLVAQKTSALWSYLMGSAAVIGMILSAFGVFLVWRTFSATQEANAIAREIGEAQTRAYLTIEGAVYESYIGRMEVKFPIRNAGQSPARRIKIECEIFWQDMTIYVNLDKETADIEPPDYSWHREIPHIYFVNDIPSGGTFFGGFVLWKSENSNLISRIATSSISPLTMKLRVRWFDVFGLENSLNFSLIGFDSEKRHKKTEKDAWEHKGPLTMSWQWEKDPEGFQDFLPKRDIDN